MGWLTGWSFRRPVIVNNANNPNLLTDYQVLVVVHTASLIQQRKMRADCNDIRFTDSDGTTLLPYWIEGPINGANTKIWVKVPSIPANGTKVIYLYYGNPTAQSESSIANTFIREIDGAQPVRLALPMDEGSGSTVYDQSGNNYNGTIYGATWTAGRFGNALSFDGVDDHVTCPVISPPSQISLVCWAYITGTSATVHQDIIRRAVHMGRGYHLRWRHGHSDYLRFFLNINNTWYSIQDPTPNSSYLNSWHHFVAVYDGAQMRLYVDNTLKASRNVTGTITYDTETTLFLMSEYYSGGYMAGKLDEVLILSRALTTAEIADLYNYYGYATPNYPGRVLVRKRIDPEPTTTVGSEEVGYATRRRLLIMSM